MQAGVRGTIARMNKGVTKGSDAKSYYRVDVAEVGATHSIQTDGPTYAECEKLGVGASVVFQCELIQRPTARGQYVNQMYELGPGKLQPGK